MTLPHLKSFIYTYILGYNSCFIHILLHNILLHKSLLLTSQKARRLRTCLSPSIPVTVYGKINAWQKYQWQCSAGTGIYLGFSPHAIMFHIKAQSRSPALDSVGLFPARQTRAVGLGWRGLDVPSPLRPVTQIYDPSYLDNDADQTVWEKQTCISFLALFKCTS